MVLVQAVVPAILALKDHLAAVNVYAQQNIMMTVLMLPVPHVITNA